MSKHLVALLQVRPGEGRSVSLVIAIFLLPSLGGAIGSPAVEALFYARFGVEFLPYMYVGLGLLTFAASLSLTALLGRVSRKRLYKILPPFLALTLVASRLLVGLNLIWFYPLLWLWMSLLWTLQALITWGLAGLIYDTRQAKRLFPLFGAGGILGIAVGGLITGPLVALLDTENLLLVWATTLFLTLVVVQAALRGTAEIRPRRRRRSLLFEIQQGYRFVRGSALMRWLSATMLLASILLFSLAFPFSKAVAAQYPNEDALTGFLGVFQGSVTALAFVISLLLANRLYARYGFMVALLVLPIIYLAGFAILLVSATFLILVGFRFVQMAWLQGVADSAYQATFNVVPGDRREQTRAFVDGIPRQAGIVLVGIILAVGQETLRPQFMYGLGIVAAVLALFAVLRSRRA